MTLSDPQWMIPLSVFMFIVGCIFGSFGNVIIARLPAGESVVRPRSRCPRCKTPIASYDNIPILSFLLLRGKCRVCKEKISWRYPLVELLSGLLFLGVFLKLGPTYTMVETLILCWGGLIASFIDLDHRILPDAFTLPGIVIGLAGALINPDRSFWDAFWGVMAGGGFLWAVAFVYYALRKEEGMGGGDIKLLAWIGAVLGWKATIFCILVSSITGSLAGLLLAAIQRSGMKTSIPFGPFLVFAAILYVFLGPPFMQVYLSIFFPFGT